MLCKFLAVYCNTYTIPQKYTNIKMQKNVSKEQNATLQSDLAYIKLVNTTF